MWAGLAALFLAAQTVYSFQSNVGNFIACNGTTDATIQTVFGTGAIVGSAAVQSACLPNAVHAAEHVIPAGTQVCSVSLDSDVWNALLKVRIEAGQVNPTVYPTLTTKVAQYVGETAPVVLAFESGYFLPKAVVDKATVKCVPHVQPVPKKLSLRSSGSFGEEEEEGESVFSPKDANIRTLSDLQHRRIVSIGDFHGDLEQAKKVLKLARLVDEAGNWVGGKTIFVQTGDTIDRGPDTLEMFKYLHRLQGQATKAGGKAILLNGNHEVMLLVGDQRFLQSEERKNVERMKQINLGYDLTISEHARADRYWPEYHKAQTKRPKEVVQGEFTKLVTTRPITCKVGDNVFVHGGIGSKYAALGVAGINQKAREGYMAIANIGRTKAGMSQSEMGHVCPVLYDMTDGPLWHRTFSNGRSNEVDVCKELTQALQLLKAKRMVVGHTVNERSKRHMIDTRCEGQYVMQDVGISRYMEWEENKHRSQGNVGVTEIYGEAVKGLGAWSGWSVSAGKNPKVQGEFTWPTIVELAVVTWT